MDVWDTRWGTPHEFRIKQITQISNKKSPRTSWLKTEFPKYQNHHAWRADTPTNQSPILILDFLKTDFLQPDKMGPDMFDVAVAKVVRIRIRVAYRERVLRLTYTPKHT